QVLLLRVLRGGLSDRGDRVRAPLRGLHLQPQPAPLRPRGPAPVGAQGADCPGDRGRDAAVTPERIGQLLQRFPNVRDLVAEQKALEAKADEEWAAKEREWQ